VVFLAALVASALLLHYGFALFDLLPERGSGAEQIKPSERFAIDYTFFLNLTFLAGTGVLVWLAYFKSDDGENGHDHDHGGGTDWTDRLLAILAYGSFFWLAGGLLAGLLR